MVHTVYVALGTNIGDRPANLEAALAALHPAIELSRRSPIYETQPWGYADQPAFLNMVIEGQTLLPPLDLLAQLKDLEQTLGRTPTFRNGPRLIDLDILFYDDLLLDTPALVIPHPRLHERTFVLVPLAQLAPGFVHPRLRSSIIQLLDALDTGGVTLFRPALAGKPGQA